MVKQLVCPTHGNYHDPHPAEGICPRCHPDPVRGRVYSLRELLGLRLWDSPHLCFGREDHEVIQTAHLTEEQLLSCPGLADTQWRYSYRTSEWCEIFHLAGDVRGLLPLLDKATNEWGDILFTPRTA